MSTYGSLTHHTSTGVSTYGSAHVGNAWNVSTFDTAKSIVAVVFDLGHLFVAAGVFKRFSEV